MLSPLEVERNELGYSLEEVRGKFLRIVKREHASSDCCVFLLHGGGGRAGQFKHQITGLEKEYVEYIELNVVAVDFLGHGDSPKPNQPQLYTEEQHFEDLKVLFERHKKSQNILVAHCYGCIHVLQLVGWLRGQGREAEVGGVVMMALGGNCPTSVGALAKMPAFVLEWLRPLARSASNAAIFTPTTDPALIEFENTITNGNRMYMMKVLGSELSSQEQWERWLAEGREALGNIPRGLLCGDQDGVFPVSSCEQVKQQYDVSDEWFRVVTGVGHLAMLESPGEVNSYIRDFMAAHLT